VLFMTGFLVNSTAMSGLFYLLNHDWVNKNRTADMCLPHKELYEYSINVSCPFFAFVSIFTFLVVCLMQCRNYNLDKGAYKITSILAATTFFWSILLVIISTCPILSFESNSCPKKGVIWELKVRYVFQSVASLITSSIYLIVGVCLVRHRRSTVSPLPPQTPVYHIQPPEFDLLFPPPPSYQQSQMQHQRRPN